MSDNFRNILKTGSNLSTLMSTYQVLNGAKNGSMYMTWTLPPFPNLSLFDVLLGNRRGFGNLIFPFWFVLIGGYSVFLNAVLSFCSLCSLSFWTLWFIYDWHGTIIIITSDVGQSNVAPPKENELAQFQLGALVTKPLKFGATLLHLPPHAIQKVA
jgi:hypothetical protein